MTREEVTSAIRAAKTAKKLTWQEIAKALGKSPVWTTSVCLGQNSMSAEQADKLVSFLRLPAEASAVLQQFPTKGNVLDVPKDPLLYRFHEINLVYGQTIKEQDSEFLSDGLKRHPQASEKIGCGVRRFYRDRAPKFGTPCFWIERNDGSTEKFSFQNCVTGRDK